VLFGGGALVLLSLLALAYCALELATTRASQVRGLPKPLWFVVLLLPLIGPLAWFLLGRPRSGGPRPRVLPPSGRSNAPDDDDAFLRELRRRAEEQRRRARDPRDEDGRSSA
jgi:hypothetical protein